MNIRSEKGVSIIELAMVVVILGTLSAIAYPKYTDLTDDARSGAMLGVVGAVRSGISFFYAANGGQYPSDLDSVANNKVANEKNPLFSTVITNAVKDGIWYKNSKTEYQYRVNETLLYVWVYDNTTGSFTSEQLEGLSAPPGQGGLNPGDGGLPPGQSDPPPGQEGSTPGSGGTPPGQGNIPPGQGGSPPGQDGSPPGHNDK